MDLSQLNQNPFFSGGLVLMLLGAIFAYFRTLPGQIWNFIERFFILKIEILDEDEAYTWMQIWLSDKLKDTLSVSVVTKRKTHEDDDEEDIKIKDRRPKIYFVPAVGTYFFCYKGKFVTLHRDRKENATSGSMLAAATSDSKGMLRTKESFTLRVYTRNKKLAYELIEEARKMASPDDGKIDIRTATYGYWNIGCRIRPRSIDGVILDGNQADFLKKDVNNFLNSYEWYKRTGVPYRRSYLLYGEPGNGKTSIIKALAGEFDMSIYSLMLSDTNMNDNRVNELLAKVADKNIILLEDIDCAFKKRVNASGREGGLTFSGLLNAMDGVASAEGRITFMTTNHKDRLDPALIRPGRADVKLYFGNATQNQASRMFARFFPDLSHLSGDFASLIPERKYSMATLQDYLMTYRDYPEKALKSIDDLQRLKEQLELPEPPPEPEFLRAMDGSED